MGSFSINVGKADSVLKVPRILSEKWRTIYGDYGTGKFGFDQIRNRQTADTKRIGLRAVMLGDGFRNDGSYYYCQNVMKKLRNMEEGLARIEKGGHFFDFGGEVSSESLAELERLAGFCRERNIHLVAFLPPYSHAAYERLKAKGKYGYVFMLPELARPIVERSGFELHDFSDLAVLGIPDSQSFDVYHPTEMGTLRLFLQLAESDPVLRGYCDIAALKALVAGTDSDFCAFEN